MPSDLTLPGDIVGLLRRGSPVVCLKPEGDEPAGVQGLVQEPPGGLANVIVVSWRDPGDIDNIDEWFYETNGERVALNLTDATGRAHAAWWLALNQPPDALGGVRPMTGAYGWERHSGWRSWGLVRPNGMGSWFWSPKPKPAGGGLTVPSLDTLDPNDPRLLEDGSRWVDAEALRLVCLHVAGRSS